MEEAVCCTTLHRERTDLALDTRVTIMTTPITFRPPSASVVPQPSSFPAPKEKWLEGTWHVTHSTLPMWKSKRNVKITYKVITRGANIDKSPQNDLDDVVEYQTMTSDKVKTVHGNDVMGERAWDWHWRGHGWLKIATSHWEVLGYGNHEGGDWVVTYFAKTLFTPAGVDIYSRAKEGLSESLLSEIKEAMGKVDDPRFKKLVGDIFEIKHDRPSEG